MRISICVPSARSSSVVSDCLDSLSIQSFSDWEALIVGQGQQDSELRSLVQRYSKDDSRFRYINIPEKGVSRARNAGASSATGEIIAFIDDDCVADADWVSTILECFDADPSLSLVGGDLVAAPRDRWRVSTCPQASIAESVYRPGPGVPPPDGWGWLGANFAVRRSVVERADVLFDVFLGAGAELPAAEETDLLMRFERNGLSMLSTPRAVVYHKHGRRYGLRSVLRQLRSYALGNGALAAKLTLMGDKGGIEWKKLTLHECMTSWMPFRMHRLPSNLWRLAYFNLGYRRCLRRYVMPAGSEVLQPRHDS